MATYKLVFFPACLETQFRCGTGTCISGVLVADGLSQCPDGSDERVRAGDPFLDSMRTGSEDTSTTSTLAIIDSLPCL